MHADARPPRPWALVGMELFVGLGALYGGGSLVADPSGGLLGMPVELLASSPFHDYLIPGLTLLLVNGVGSLVGMVLSLARVRWAGALGLVLGAFLVAWIVLQVLWIGPISWFQPAMLACGLAEAWLGRRAYRGAGRHHSGW
jgi:hypothetical protein